MSKELQVFKNDLFQVEVTLEDGSILFDAECVARSLGFTETKDGKEYIRWRTINGYLKGKVSQDVAKGDFIPESMVYKLAFKASNETAEKFQDWLAIEVIPQIRKTGSYSIDTSALSPELQLLNTMIQAMNKQALGQLKLEEAIQENHDEIQSIREVVEIRPFDNWRDDTNKMVNKICKATGDYKDTRTRIYEALSKRAGADLKRRLENMRARGLMAGMARSKADALTILDVIEEDKKLIEIYVAIVKEMAIKKGVA